MRPVTIVAPPNYPVHTGVAENALVPAFAAGAVPTVYAQPPGFQRSILWVQNELLDKTVPPINPFPNPSSLSLIHI